MRNTIGLLIFGPPFQGAPREKLDEARRRLEEETTNLVQEVRDVGGHHDPIGLIVRNIKQISRG